MSYKTAELTTGVILLLAAVFAGVNLSKIPESAAMFPIIIVIMMGVGSVMMIIRSLTGVSRRVQGETVENWSFTIHRVRCIGGIVLFVIYLTLVEPLGYFTASTLFIITAAITGQFRNWKVLPITALGFCLFVYLMFVLIFNRTLPQEFFIAALSAAGGSRG